MLLVKAVLFKFDFAFAFLLLASFIIAAQFLLNTRIYSSCTYTTIKLSVCMFVPVFH